jgi:hypothetical protein
MDQTGQMGGLLPSGRLTQRKPSSTRRHQRPTMLDPGTRTGTRAGTGRMVMGRHGLAHSTSILGIAIGIVAALIVVMAVTV